MKKPSSRSANAEATGLPARRAALKLLDAVLRRGEALDLAQHAALQGLVQRSDKALAIAIAAETLRHLPGLDSLIDSATSQPLPDDAKARMVLRIMLVQTLAMGTPPHAAVSSGLDLVQGGPKRLVHGVFGTLTRADATLPQVTLPEATAIRWTSHYGTDIVTAAAMALAAPPALDLTIGDPLATDDWAQRLGGQSLMSGHVRIARSGPIEALAGFAEGGWWVQDLAASLPARLLGKGDNRTALDLCAAPGGKAMQLASAGWSVAALDKSRKRIDRLAANAQRTGLAIETIAADLMDWAPEHDADAILLDAPCSATGIFRRHPDVLYRVGRPQIAAMADVQAQLLDRAASWLSPGGRLVYAVCSLEPEEGEDQIARFLAEHPEFVLDPVTQTECPDGVAPAAEGWLRTLPGMLAEQGGLDGFFMARLKHRQG